MTLNAFKASLTDQTPPALSAPLSALWWTGRGGDGWDRAHLLVQDAPGSDATWVHAYLHRVEGDLENARYWYQQAERPSSEGPLAAEWEAIASALLTA